MCKLSHAVFTSCVVVHGHVRANLKPPNHYKAVQYCHACLEYIEKCERVSCCAYIPLHLPGYAWYASCVPELLDLLHPGLLDAFSSRKEG